MVLLNGEDAHCWKKSAEPEILRSLPLILMPPSAMLGPFPYRKMNLLSLT